MRRGQAKSEVEVQNFDLYASHQLAARLINLIDAGKVGKDETLAAIMGVMSKIVSGFSDAEKLAVLVALREVIATQDKPRIMA